MRVSTFGNYLFVVVAKMFLPSVPQATSAYIDRAAPELKEYLDLEPVIPVLQCT